MQNENDRLRLSVTLKMNDGREVDGDLIVNIGGTLERTLNNDAKFVLFGDPDGSERMIAKSSILEALEHKKSRNGAQPTRRPTATQTPQEPSVPTASADPYEILGVVQTASDAEIQSAFVERMAAYHPDRFQQVHLPAEVSDYIDSMSKSINAAYKQLMKDKSPVLTTHMMPPVARAG